MLGGKTVKVKIDRDLHDRVRKIADVAGYATAEEFITHVLEKELLGLLPWTLSSSCSQRAGKQTGVVDVDPKTNQQRIS